MQGFTRTTVESVTDEAAEQVRIVLADPSGLVDAHERPGQYCHLRVPGGEPSFYALLSTPAERMLCSS
jgi:ferredoxin-NADP reductase